MKRPVPTAEGAESFLGGHRGWSSPQFSMLDPVQELTRRGRVVVLVDALSLYYGALQLRIKVDYGLLLQYLARDCQLVHAFFYTGIDLVEQLAAGSPKHSSEYVLRPLSPRSMPVSGPSASPNSSKPSKKSRERQRRRSPRKPSSVSVSGGTDAEHQFINRLRRQGYRVITKEVQYFPDGSRKLDLDVEIAIDMMKLSKRCDRMVLVSGDDTLAYAVKVVGDRGVRSEVVSLRDMTSQRLLEVADDYCDLYTIREQIQLQ